MPPKLTKEEKKAKKEAQRLEKLRLENEKRKDMRRAELVREMAMQAVRRAEVDKTWQDIMVKIKEPVFMQEAEIMWHTFERAYDKKDHLISHLMKLIDTADDQFQRTIAAFCDIIDNMINKFLSDLENLSKENDIRTAALLKWGENIKNKLQTDHNAAELHLQLLIYHGNTTSENYKWNTRGEYLVMEDAERSNFLDIRDNLRSFLENTYNNMWDEYKSVLKAYVQGTAENQKHVRRLRRKENVMADIIASQGKRIANSDKILSRLRGELAMYESGSKQAAFRDRRDRHRAAAHSLKSRLIVGVRTDEERLATLVKSSDDAMKWMEGIHKKGVKIIRLAALCRKFETQREKVLPFGSDIPPESTQSKTNLRHQQSDDSLLNVIMAAANGLTRLWHRISKADLAKRALLREKMILENENALILERIADLHERTFHTIQVDPTKCTCNPVDPKNIVKPVAIDGGLEIARYRKYY